MNGVVVKEFGKPEVLKYQTLDIPEIKNNQVLIRTFAASVNFADIKARLGLYHGGQEPPFIPGLDVAGEIVALGDEVKGLKTGQKVVAFTSYGSYAEYVTAEAILTYPIPNTLNFETAAAFPVVGFTAYNLLKRAMLKKGDTVLIHTASGGVGTVAIQIAKLLGAGKVIGTASSEEKVEFIIKHGADHGINYKSDNFPEIIMEITEGEGADIILDSLSGEVFNKSMECLGLFGRIVSFGNGLKQESYCYTNNIHKKCQTVIGYSLGTTIKHQPETLIDTAEAVIPLVTSGQLKVSVNGKFHLKDAALAHESIEKRKNTGKIILLP